MKRPLTAFLGALILLGLATGCSTPVGIKPTSTRNAYENYNANALAGELSNASRLVLHRFNLAEIYEDTPARALAFLHDRAAVDARRDILFALAELSYHHADSLRRSPKPGNPARAPDSYLASSIYAYLYLLGDGGEPRPTSFDRRFRIACDLYNHALSHAFRPAGSTNRFVLPATTLRSAPAGHVQVSLVTNQFPLELDRVDRFLVADEYQVRGLTVRDRQAGLGAPLIVVERAFDGRRFKRRLAATAFLRVEGDVRSWMTNTLKTTLELHLGYGEQRVEIAGEAVPLETDLTAPVAYTLSDSRVWSLGRQQFFSPEERIKSDIYVSQPYERGRVPVVFVHGTLSSPVWWAEMVNTLRADPTLRTRCQFWYFIYNSGNPVAYSANLLRSAIGRTIENLDPEGRDPALTNMVVVGHSQGGLLAKLTAVNTGNKLWDAVTRAANVGTADAPQEPPPEIRPYFEFDPLPFVRRVVFMSTPHRGSYQARDWVRKLARHFVKLPQNVIRAPAQLLNPSDPSRAPSDVRGVSPTSIDQMAPNSPWLLALADLPPAPGVVAHSIIPVRDLRRAPSSDDGVVKYTSAHVDYAASEFLLQGGHSCQDKPAAIEEVRRILLEHLRGLDAR